MTDISWAGGHTYNVVDADNKVVQVSLKSLQCTCENDESCDHLRAAIAQAEAAPTTEDRITIAHINLLGKALDLVTSADGDTRSESASGGREREQPDVNEELDTSISQPFDSDEAELMVESVRQWIADKSDEYEGLRPERIDVKWAEVRDELGVIIDSQYFEPDEARDANREALREITEPVEEIVYYGKPNWFNFIRRKHIEDVTQ